MGTTIGSMLDPPADARADRRFSRQPFLAALGISVLGYVAVTAATIGIGLLLKHPLEGTVGAWDWDVAEFFARHRSNFLNDITKQATSGVGKFLRVGHASLPAMIIAGVVVIFLARRGRWREGSFLAIAFAIEFFAYRSVIHPVSRLRPPFFDLDKDPSSTSFPSGHTAAATVLFVGIMLIVMWSTNNKVARVLSTLVAVGGVGMVGFSRVYRGAHSLLDVLVGVLLGLACLAVAAVAVRAASRRVARPAKRVPTKTRNQPPV